MDVAYASARDRLGQTLCGKYHIDEVLGIGGTAVVFRATHRNGNRVAVKLLHDYLCKSRDVTLRFMREAYLANLLEHPGTVRVLDDDVDENGVAFLVLELLEGETLEERRVRVGGRLTVDETLGYMDRLLEVLELAHEKQIVHRDIKPSNLFLTKDGVLKVLDFGIARMLDDQGSSTATKTGQMIGTPAFMPPEQALSKPNQIDSQTDLWAVGATMFTLMSGELVHVAESSSEHLVKAATLHARSVARVLPGVPMNVETLIGRALRFEKTERWASASEMRRELWKVRLDPGMPSSSQPLSKADRAVASDFPTVVGRRDSDKSGLRETGMTLSGDLALPDPSSRRAVFVSTIIALVLVASACIFGIWLMMNQQPRIERPAAAATEAPPAPFLPPPSLDGAENAELAKPATTGVPASTSKPASAVVTASSTKSVGSAGSASGAGAKKRAPSAASAPSADLYKPF